jgi:hypothetical protein
MSSTTAKRPDSLSGLLNHFVETTEEEDQVTIGELLDSLDGRSHGPMLLLPAILAISPLGMIPGMSIVTGSLIILIAAQMMFFSQRPWLPSRLADFQFSRERLKNGVDRIQPWVKKFEKAVSHRWEILARGPAIYPVAMLSILLAATFYPLAFLPFGVFLPGLAVAAFGLGLTAQDGLLIAIGFCLTVTALGVIVYNFF